MADIEELKETLKKVQAEMESLKTEAAKATKLEKDIEETKKELSEYKATGKTVYISKDRKLEKFSGRPVKDSDPTAETWIEDAKYHLRNISGSSAQVEFLYDHLQGQAKGEVRIRPESDRNSAEKIFSIIRALFQDAETVGQLQQRFYQRNQKSTETLQEYSLVLMKLADRIVKKDKTIVGDMDLMLKERFTDGVNDTQLRREMRRFMFEHKSISFADFRQLVLKWTEDEMCKGRISSQEIAETEEIKVKSMAARDKTGAKESTSGMSTEMMSLFKSQQEMIQKQQQQLDLLTKIVGHSDSADSDRGSDSRGFRGGRGRGFGRGRGRGRGSTVCYSCGGKGHFSRECPTKQRNFNKRKSVEEGDDKSAKDGATGGKNLNG